MITSSSKLNDCFDQYISECEYTKKLSPQTMSSYQDVIKNFINMMPEVKTPLDLQPFIVHEFFKRLGERAKRNGKELKTSTIRTSQI